MQLAVVNIFTGRFSICIFTVQRPDICVYHCVFPQLLKDFKFALAVSEIVKPQADSVVIFLHQH